MGSDPARVSTTAEKTEDGSAYILNGKKLWTTNGTIAKLLVVMAADPKTHKISAFIVETEWKGVVIENRCRFMGLKALANAVVRFDNVRVPVENLVGEEGRGSGDVPRGGVQGQAHHQLLRLVRLTGRDTVV